jgi:hypothetical protein
MAIKGGGLGLKIVGLKKKPKMEKNEIEQFSIHIVNEYVVAGIEHHFIKIVTTPPLTTNINTRNSDVLLVVVVNLFHSGKLSCIINSSTWESIGPFNF